MVHLGLSLQLKNIYILYICYCLVKELNFLLLDAPNDLAGLALFTVYWASTRQDFKRTPEVKLPHSATLSFQSTIFFVV